MIKLGLLGPLLGSYNSRHCVKLSWALVMVVLNYIRLSWTVNIMSLLFDWIFFGSSILGLFSRQSN